MTIVSNLEVPASHLDSGRVLWLASTARVTRFSEGHQSKAGPGCLATYIRSARQIAICSPLLKAVKSRDVLLALPLASLPEICSGAGMTQEIE